MKSPSKSKNQIAIYKELFQEETYEAKVHREISSVDIKKEAIKRSESVSY
jgi:hypothetical protein